MIDLAFATPRDRKKFDCSTCPANVKLARKCGKAGYDNLKAAPRIDDQSLDYTFCPGKATWHASFGELLSQCRVALETGILPRRGTLEDQDELFADVFPSFILRWRERTYGRFWKDAEELVSRWMNALFGKKK